jgi:hypothetical protein
MSKLSKRVDELEAAFENIMKVGVRCKCDSGLEAKVATLQKQMSCDCSAFEIVEDNWGRFNLVGGQMEPLHYKRCLSCGLRVDYRCKKDAMKDKDALLKAEIDNLTAERKSLKEDN